MIQKELSSLLQANTNTVGSVQVDQDQRGPLSLQRPWVCGHATHLVCGVCVCGVCGCLCAKANDSASECARAGAVHS